MLKLVSATGQESICVPFQFGIGGNEVLAVVDVLRSNGGR